MKDLDKIIRPLSSARYQVDVFFNGIERSLEYYKTEYGGLDINPDFQRGHVWTLDQQTHFIENVLRGIVTSAGLVIQWNCPQWDEYDYKGSLPLGFQCIDGLQRLTAVRKYIAGEVNPFGLSIEDLHKTTYDVRRSLFSLKFAVHNMTSRKELLNYYLDLNAGGTQHTEAEINKVKSFLKEENK